MNQIFDAARVLLSLVFLVYASWSDYRTREVSNMIWVFLAPSALALTLLEFLMGVPMPWQIYVLSFAITSVIALALFYAGAYGGADAKALICLSLALPAYPSHLITQPTPILSPIFPITVFTNAVLLAALSVLYALFRNLVWKVTRERSLFEGLERESAGRKILTLLCGYKVKTSELEETDHLYPLEDFQVNDTGEGERKLIVFPKDEERGEIVARVLEATDKGKLEKEVWATPGLPMLIFITAGLFVALAYGDIIWALLRLILP